MPEMESKLDKLVEGVAAMNEINDKLEKSVGALEVDTKQNLENVKAEVEKIVTEMQEDKQKNAAIAQEQKETLELLQKEIISGTSNDTMEKSFKEYDQHLARYFRKNIAIPENEVETICNDIMQKALYGADEGTMSHEAKSLVAGSNVDGGFFLTTQRSDTMSTRIFETSPLRPLANVQTTTSDMWETILDDGEPNSGWVGEVTARPETDTAEIGLIKIPIHELYAAPKATQKMIDDAGFDIVSWHQGKVTRKFSRMENTAFVVGDGASKPHGFLSYAAWATAGTYQRDAVEQITSAASGVIDADDLLAVQGSLISDYEMMSQWAMNRNTLFNDIFTLKDTQGQYLINPRLVAEGGQMVVLGRPVNLFEDMADVAANSLSVALADWREFYTIVDRLGIRVVRDPYTAKPYVIFYTTKRTGGAVTNYEAGKILKTKA